jgi:hypothetical protein
VFCNNVLKFYTHTMDSLDENEFCETNVKEGAKRTNDSLSFLFVNNLKYLKFSLRSILDPSVDEYQRSSKANTLILIFVLTISRFDNKNFILKIFNDKIKIKIKICDSGSQGMTP